MLIARYQKLLHDFSNMNLDTSWVSFSKEKVQFNGVTRDVLVPQIRQKPWKLIRWIQKLFALILKTSPHMQLAQNLDLFFQQTQPLFLTDPNFSKNSLHCIQKASQVAMQILNKLDKKSKIAAPSKIQAYIASAIQKQAEQETRQKLCAGHQLSPEMYQVHYSMNWDQDHPWLYDPAYIYALSEKHPDLTVVNYAVLGTFIKFLTNLLESKVTDFYGNKFSQDNVNRLRQMVFAILNTLNARRSEKGFLQCYAAVVSQICHALQNCTNGINTNIENIYTTLVRPQSGGIGEQVKLALQLFRDRLFRTAIRNAIQQSKDPSFYHQHEASTVSYYFVQLSNKIGLPTSVSSLDRHYQNCALIDQESSILRTFHEHYTPETVLQFIWNAIHDPEDPAVSSQWFTDWVRSKYGENYDVFNDEGTYKIEVVFEFLKEQNIVQPVQGSLRNR